MQVRFFVLSLDRRPRLCQPRNPIVVRSRYEYLDDCSRCMKHQTFTRRYYRHGTCELVSVPPTLRRQADSRHATQRPAHRNRPSPHTLAPSPPDLAGDGAAQRHPPFRLDILVAIYAVAAAAPAAVAAPRGGELRKDRVACRRVRVLQLACPVEGGDPAACSVSGAPREYRGWCRNLKLQVPVCSSFECRLERCADLVFRI